MKSPSRNVITSAVFNSPNLRRHKQRLCVSSWRPVVNSSQRLFMACAVCQLIHRPVCGMMEPNVAVMPIHPKVLARGTVSCILCKNTWKLALPGHSRQDVGDKGLRHRCTRTPAPHMQAASLDTGSARYTCGRSRYLGTPPVQTLAPFTNIVGLAIQCNETSGTSQHGGLCPESSCNHHHSAWPSVLCKWALP